MATSAPLDDQLARARALGEDLRVRAEDLSPVLRERLGDVEPALRERWEELEPVVRERLADLEPRTRQAQVGLWRALRVLFGVLATLPTLLVRGLRTLAGTADEVTERGVQVGDEVRRRRRGARRLRLRRRELALWVGGGVVVGFATGWVLGRREPNAADAYEAPATDAGPAPTDVADAAPPR